ncbi:MAG: LysM peptidoglycan-binding domain-containing protein, partial [Chloroflexi bacterium]|nr:LysM peptidoglycan-binding domain-containing protein [Chloroflexota bacterium]
TCPQPSGWSSIIVQAGETLSAIALRYGTDTTLLAQNNCLPNADAITAGQVLYVPAAPAQAGPAEPSTVTTQCANPWFFFFYSGFSDPRDDCPNPVQAQYTAWGQDFEGGRAYVYAPPVSLGQPYQVFAIFNDGTWTTYSPTSQQGEWREGDPVSDPGYVPPAGRFQPERRLGLAWRTNPDMQTKLGWAVGPENQFLGRQQTYLGAENWGWAPVQYFYIDHGKAGLVLRLIANSDTGQLTWEVVGSYG